MMTMTTVGRLAALAAMVFGIHVAAVAELQHVEPGGEIRIRGNYWMRAFNGGLNTAMVRHQVRFPGSALYARPIGTFLGAGVRSFHDWDDRGPDYRHVLQRTLLHASADFTNDVRAFIELESFDVWGEDFRSAYVTGADFRAVNDGDIEVFQIYIEASEVGGIPLRVRIGRQTLVVGDGWLIGDRQNHPEFPGLSFDGLRVTYEQDPVTVDAFWAKLAENSPAEQDGDIDIYGLTGAWRATESISLEAYGLFLRDAGAIKDTTGGHLSSWFEHLFGMDDYDPTELHIFGLRGVATFGGVDVDAQIAYQFGDAGAAGFLFSPFVYGDDGAEWDAWAAKAEAGYTFDTRWRPRVFLTAAYYEGEDNRDISFVEWPFPWQSAFAPQSSVSFNRLFSNTVHSYFLDQMGQLTNFWTVGGGVQLEFNETLSAEFQLDYFEVNEPFDYPPYISFNGVKSVWLPGLSFWTREADSELGWETGLSLAYRYSEDLTLRCGWSHFFTGDGLREGSFVDLHGLISTAGTAAEDADYFYAETSLRF